MTSSVSTNVKGRFSKDENDLISSICKEYMTANNLQVQDVLPSLRGIEDNTRKHRALWNLLASSIPHRDRQAVYKRARVVISREINHDTKWSDEDRSTLSALVATHGENFKIIGRIMERLSEDCRTMLYNMREKKISGRFQVDENEKFLAAIVKETYKDKSTPYELPLSSIPWSAVCIRLNNSRKSSDYIKHWSILRRLLIKKLVYDNILLTDENHPKVDTPDDENNNCYIFTLPILKISKSNESDASKEYKAIRVRVTKEIVDDICRDFHENRSNISDRKLLELLKKSNAKHESELNFSKIDSLNMSATTHSIRAWTRMKKFCPHDLTSFSEKVDYLLELMKKNDVNEMSHLNEFKYLASSNERQAVNVAGVDSDSDNESDINESNNIPIDVPPDIIIPELITSSESQALTYDDLVDDSDDDKAELNKRRNSDEPCNDMIMKKAKKNKKDKKSKKSKKEKKR